MAISGGQFVPKPPDEPEEAQRQRQRVVVRVLEEDERPEEAVPGALELEDRDRREGRTGERQHHPPERREEAGAVDPGRLLEVARDRQEVLAHQEDARRRDGQDQDHADVLADALGQADAR